MGAMLLDILSSGMQYLCSIALIVLCALAGFQLFLMRKRKSDGTHTAEDPPPEGLAEEPVAEPSEEPLEEPLEEPAGEDDDPSFAAIPLPGKRVIRGRYNKSFTAKLMQSADPLKRDYADLAGELLSYDKVRCRISWTNSSFYLGRRVAAKFAIRGKTLYLYLALEPSEYLNSKYYVTDESSVKRYKAVPLRMKIKSQRGVKFGKELIGILMRSMGAVRSRDGGESVKASDYPYDTTKNLLERGLIKLVAEEGELLTDPDSLVWAEFGRREEVTVSEAQKLISDEAAASLVEETDETVLPRPKGIVNIDTLSEHYEANETVTLESLKEKKLINRSVNHVKVLARGVLNKPLIVKLPEFSVDAVKMILLTGGKAIRVMTKK